MPLTVKMSPSVVPARTMAAHAAIAMKEKGDMLQLRVGKNKKSRRGMLSQQCGQHSGWTEEEGREKKRT